MIVLSLLVLMIFWSYSFAVFKDPGYMQFFINKNDASENEIEEAKKRSYEMKEMVSL